MILYKKNSVIYKSKQAKKWRFLIGICLGSGAVIILGIIALFLDLGISKVLLSLFKENIWSIVLFCAMATELITMICLSVLIKCPRCNLKWFWYGLAKDDKGDIGIGHMSNCPRCNYPDKEIENITPVSISKKPILEASNQTNKFRRLWRIFFVASAITLGGIVGLIYHVSLFGVWRICFFGGLITAILMLVCLWISIKCPQCGLKWYWYAFSKDSKYLRIGRIMHCPRCDYPGSNSF